MLTRAEQRYSQMDNKEGLTIVFGVKHFHNYVHGHNCLIKSDHKPLFHIFNECKGIPPIASARLQKWALTLSAYKCTIEYCPDKNMFTADALSHLPLPITTSSDVFPGILVQLINHLSSTPVTAPQVKEWKRKTLFFAQVKQSVMSGWPTQTLGCWFHPFVSKHSELSVFDGCLL